MEDLNNQLAQLSQDYIRKQEIQEIRTKLAQDPKHNQINNKLAELRAFNPLAGQPGPNIRLITNADSSQPRHTRLEYDVTLNNPVQAANKLQQDQYHNPQIQQAHYQSPLLSQSQQPPQAPAQQQHQNRPSIYTREDMNSRMDQFRFDNSTQPRGSLVPVNMDHFYSGNLFSEGNPVPEDLRGEYNPGQRSHPNARVHYQEKSKTIYRDEFNSRLSALSPLARTLYYPVGNENDNNAGPAQHQPRLAVGAQQPYHESVPSTLNSKPTSSGREFSGMVVPLAWDSNPMPTVPIPKIESRRGELKQDISNRMTQHMPLSANMAMPPQFTDIQDQNMYSRTELVNQYNRTNQQPVKVPYNAIYPVSSK